MSPQEQRVRTVVLAQALEQADPQGKWLTLEARHAATLFVLHSLKTSVDVTPADDELLVWRARRVLDLLPASHLPPAVLEKPSLMASALAFAMPVVALLAGIATDHIADPHRVDLLSGPLLLVIGFNLLMYTLLALQALWRKPIAGAALLSRALAHFDDWRLRHRNSHARVTGDFYLLWHQLTAKLMLQRCKTVLHLSAAAWGAGIAMSLAIRGLSAEYRAGWESTFLDASQVHKLLEFIFWLPRVVFNLMPITRGELDALRNFSTAGVAGARWVWMYVGLIALLVVVPRLLLAAWAAVSAASMSRKLQIPLQAPYFQAVLASMRNTRMAVGLVFSGDPAASQRSQFLRLAKVAADDPLAQWLATSTPEADRLQWVEEPASATAVDLVLCIAESGRSDACRAIVPGQWSDRPMAIVSPTELALVWQQWPMLCRVMERRLGLQTSSGWKRIQAVLMQRQAHCLLESMKAVAAYLCKVAVQLEAAKSDEATGKAFDELFLTLQHLHCLDRETGRMLEQKLVARYAAPALMGLTPAATASAATGASLGLAIDASTGFMSLGAGAALGALVGAGMGWAAVAWRKKEAVADTLQRLTEAALLLYMEIAQTARVHASTADVRATWQAEIARQVQQRKLGLLSHWRASNGTAEPVARTASVQLLSDTLEAIIATLYPQAVPSAPAEIVGRMADF